jgi:hypothetical protein
LVYAFLYMPEPQEHRNLSSKDFELMKSALHGWLLHLQSAVRQVLIAVQVEGQNDVKGFTK